MRKTLFAMAAVLAATTAHAETTIAPGLTLETEVKAFHKVDAETNHVTINPEVTWDINGPASFTLGTTITAYDDSDATTDDFILFDALDEGSRPNIELGAYYDLVPMNGQLYAETEWEVDNQDRTELEMGISFKF